MNILESEVKGYQKLREEAEQILKECENLINQELSCIQKKKEHQHQDFQNKYMEILKKQDTTKYFPSKDMSSTKTL